eukprot:CAMPEP_0181177588 /NCGR_PEP_ID=MMETSP1096-20121128/5251_1 /TAXON_ID=156174 ORGANISM="Chrysochromulina ericina, Strain CCMP281" /NCGR_SAMPLE_ID=MMETSP1096 /ASSEMBLY_ACC=CAM_ASM_000453 /LENGTH=108 /DNA_ID=CAMNT_0023265769 /DNA_START=85 /DNA_END=411 /DNA_ORIENTATION=+
MMRCAMNATGSVALACRHAVIAPSNARSNCRSARSGSQSGSDSHLPACVSAVPPFAVPPNASPAATAIWRPPVRVAATKALSLRGWLRIASPTAAPIARSITTWCAAK